MIFGQRPIGGHWDDLPPKNKNISERLREENRKKQGELENSALWWRDLLVRIFTLGICSAND